MTGWYVSRLVQTERTFAKYEITSIALLRSMGAHNHLRRFMKLLSPRRVEAVSGWVEVGVLSSGALRW